MASDSHYRIVESQVAHEIIEGEAIVIHFETENYYSLTGVAAELWEWFAGCQASRPQILEALAPLTPEQVQSVDAFLDSLVSEGLLEEDGPAEAGLPPLLKSGTPFEPPAFEKHNDMQDLLRSNPAHAVDVSGWPTQPPAVA